MSCLRWCRPATSLPFCNMSPVFRLWIRRVHFAKRRCDRRNSLHQHKSVVHAKHWRNASSLAATLNSRFQKLQHCYCRPVLQCKGKPHLCIVFKQYSLLRTVRFLDADNTALIQDREVPVAHDVSQDLHEPQADAPTDTGIHFEEYDDSQDVPDEVLASGLQ